MFVMEFWKYIYNYKQTFNKWIIFQHYYIRRWYNVNQSKTLRFLFNAIIELIQSNVCICLFIVSYQWASLTTVNISAILIGTDPTR